MGLSLFDIFRKPKPSALYHIQTDKGSFGPINISILKKIGLKRDSMIWNQESKDWVKADELPELRLLFQNLPVSLDKKESVFEYGQIKSKIALTAFFHNIKSPLIISFFIALLSFPIFWLIYKPYKFGDDDITKIEKHWDDVRQKSDNEFKTEVDKIGKQEEENYLRLHPGDMEGVLKLNAEHIFSHKHTWDEVYGSKNGAIVPVGPGANIDYSYYDGFWDYSGKNSGVILDITNPRKSFESRKGYLISKTIKNSLLAFSATLILLTLFAYLTSTPKRHK
jgi:hypothetical protein